jgi:hypothetical protein
MDEFRRLWREHLDAGYPDGYRDKDVAGVALILLDADIAGCVSASLGGARLDPERATILERCYRDAVVVTRVLEANGRLRAVCTWGGTRESAGRGWRAENGCSVNWAFVPSMLSRTSPPDRVAPAAAPGLTRRRSPGILGAMTTSRSVC